MTILNALPTVAEKTLVKNNTQIRFVDASMFRTPEALICFEQDLLPEEKLFELCNEAYDGVLTNTKRRYIPRDIIQLFFEYSCYPISYDANDNVITVATLPEFYKEVVTVSSYRIRKVCVPIYTYVQERTLLYGVPNFIYPIPVKDKLEFIYAEALQLGASEITISNNASGALVYYNCRRKKVHSRRAIMQTDVNEMITYIASKGKAALNEVTNDPRYLSVSINRHVRGRVTINKNYYGFLMSIRLWTTELLNSTLESLNLDSCTCAFIREIMLSDEKGLRLVIGETMSGKNSTILTALKIFVDADNYKIVSIENPVEQLIDGIEQINVETADEFQKNAMSLLRQNPDIIYFGEMNDMTAKEVIIASNTSKAVFSTLHANSIADCISRIVDITGMSAFRIISSLQSCIYQKLVRDDNTDSLHPITTCVHFDSGFKRQLYELEMNTMAVRIAEKEAAWMAYVGKSNNTNSGEIC